MMIPRSQPHSHPSTPLPHNPLHPSHQIHHHQQQQSNVHARSPYNFDQLVCISETLYRANDRTALVRFFNYLSPDEYRHTCDPSILRARLSVHLFEGQFDEIYGILKSYQFEQKYHDELQDFWWRAHYAELESQRGKPLGAVEKYRLRKKFPPPFTIWDGEETIYSFKENSRKLLKLCYKQNKYPCAEEKKMISERTGLTFVQVSNWFKNRRQREKSSQDEADDDDDADDDGSTSTMMPVQHRLCEHEDEICQTILP